jgi:hypothetical protein
MPLALKSVIPVTVDSYCFFFLLNLYSVLQFFMAGLLGLAASKYKSYSLVSSGLGLYSCQASVCAYVFLSTANFEVLSM